MARLNFEKIAIFLLKNSHKIAKYVVTNIRTLKNSHKNSHELNL